jgi:hypothetical protein
VLSRVGERDRREGRRDEAITGIIMAIVVMAMAKNEWGSSVRCQILVRFTFKIFWLLYF